MKICAICGSQHLRDHRHLREKKAPLNIEQGLVSMKKNRVAGTVTLL